MDIITTPVQEIALSSEQIVHETSVDLVTRYCPDVVRLTQYDNSLPVIAVALKRSGQDYVLPAGAACNIRVRKQDGTTDYEPATGCDSSRKTAYFEVTDEMTDVAGELETTLEVVVSGEIAGTSPMNIVVEENPVSEDALGMMRSAPVALMSNNIDPITTVVEEVTISSERIIHVTEVDMVTRRVPKMVRLVQYDATLPVLAVTLSEHDVIYQLPIGASCNIRIKKPDGTVVYNPAYGCDSTRSVIYYEVTGQMAAVFGELHGVLEVIVSGKVAYSSPLRIVVEENPVKNDDYESEDETRTIIGFVGDAQAARDEAVGSATAAAGSATAAAGSATAAAGSATSASGSAAAASSSATSASGSATSAAGSATSASQSATSASGSATAAANSAAQAAASAALIDPEAVLGNFATFEETTTASKAYTVGEYLTYNGHLYKVTAAIASGGTIAPNTNCIQTSVGAEIETIFGSITTYEPNASSLSKGYKVGEYCIANGKLYRFIKRVFYGDAIVAGTYTSSDNAVETTIAKEMSTDKLWYYHVPVTATTGQIVDIIDSRITPQHVLSEITWADSSKITSLTQWTTDVDGHFSITGAASAATECTVLLVRANVIEDWSE